ncbi:proton-coupled folate transporter-like isoform X2 [Pieris napi]|uniref:proton-coupled folate transporter-like isoform X2 n=1 Tax=Pieris napi TaxID=78633 RepID=UPI001FBA92BA|nr:proton-coupled folate transporter-like isoform X2 [Pieris napi]
MTLRVEVPGEKIVNVDTCKCTKSFSSEIKKREGKLSRRIKQIIKNTWSFRSKVTVEPYVVCYILPSVLAGLAVQNLCLEKSCLVNLNYDERTCTNIMQGRTSNLTEQEQNVQKMVASMTAWSFPLQTALPGILALFVGAWSDRTGNRKTFMVLPILGKLISIIGIILSTMFFRQVGVNETAVIEGLPPALAGGRVAMTMAVYSYITDITSESERTFRLGIITAILTLSRPIGLALSGIMTKRFGYYGVFTVACFFYLTGFVYILLRLKEKTKKTVETDNKESVSFSVKDLIATVNVAFQPREGFRRLQIILIMFAYMLIVGPVLGSFITIYLFSKRWKIEDSIIGIIACVSRVAASLVYAMAPNRTVYFLGPVLDMFSAAAATSLRSIATKLVNADEVGKTSSLISISEALVPVIYSPVYSKVYLSTLSTFAGAFYLISASLAVPASLIYITLYIIRRKEIQQEQSTENKRDGEVTRF